MLKFMRNLTLWMLLMILSGCSLSISTTGASISTDTKTCKIAYFQNRARIINPSLSGIFTDALRDKIESQTPLKLVTGDSDVSFEGEITGYDTQPAAITGDNVAALDRLTITVNVVFTNTKTPDFSFTKSFSRYADYSRSATLQSVESGLVTDIVKELLDDIYNQAFVNW